MRYIPSATVTAKNLLANAEPWFWLLEMDLNDAQTLRICSGAAIINYGGNDYYPFPFQIGDQTEDGGGTPSTLSISVTNITTEVGAFIEYNRGFPNKKVRLFLMNDGIAMPVGVYSIQSSRYDSRVAVFTVGYQDVMNILFPRERFIRDTCRHIYKGPMCKYASSLPTCDLTFDGYNGCLAHSNAINYGGAPALSRP